MADDVIVNTDARAIVKQQNEIRGQAEAREGRYRDLDDRAHARLRSHQDTVFSLLEGRERSSELNQRDQTRLFNSLEAISAIINRAEDDRMVCERIRPTGTNRPLRVCKTVAQRREEAELAREVRPTNARCETSCLSTSGRPEGW